MIEPRPFGQTRRSLPTVKSELRSRAMRATTLSVSAVALLMVGGGVAASAVGRTGWPGDGRMPAATAPSGALAQAIIARQPYVYWAPTQEQSGNDRPALTVAGSGSAAVHSSSNPPGGAGGSILFRPSARQTGQRLQSAARPLPAGTHGTLVVWFKLARSLPGWTQTLVADNGAATGYGVGFFIDGTGRAVVSDASATVYSAPGSDSYGNNFCRPSGACPHTVTRPLNDGRWHMAAFVDQYKIGTATVTHDGWLPSLLYVDGRLVDSTIEGYLVPWMTAAKSRLLVGAGQGTQAATLGKFRGNVADVAVFDHLLTADDIKAIWSAGR